MKWQDDIVELYVEMVEGPTEEEVVEGPTEEEVVEEKSSSHAEFKEVMKILKVAMKKNLVDLITTKSGYMVKSLIDDSQFLIHKGGKGYHPLRRYLNNLSRI